MPRKLYKINEISEIAGVTPRTVHFYVQQGLLPHPDTRGAGATYEQGVELHFRRPLTRRRNRQVARFLEEARRIMAEGGPQFPHKC